jgi:1,4-dihydroxy-2-naphthoate octaprenyltransferase
MLVVAGLIGLYFLYIRGLALLPLGLLGIVSILAYTPWITRSPFLCLIAPGLGFGLFMVMGTDFVLTGSYSWAAFWTSLVPFFLVSNLLLLNQFPDVEADRSVGRRHYPIVLGRRKSSYIYAAFLLGTYLSLVVAVILDYLPLASLLGFASLLLAIPTVRGVLRYADDLGKLMPFLGLNVILTVVTPVLVGVGLLLAP